MVSCLCYVGDMPAASCKHMYNFSFILMFSLSVIFFDNHVEIAHEF